MSMSTRFVQVGLARRDSDAASGDARQRGRLAAALAARDCVRGGPRRPRVPRRATEGASRAPRERLPARGDRGAHGRAASACASCARFATAPAPSPTDAPDRASAVSGRSSPPARRAQRRRPATSTGPAAPCSASPPIALDDIGERAGLASLRKVRGRASAASRTCSATCPRRSCRARSRRPARGRSAPCSCPPAIPCCRSPTGRARARAGQLDLMVSLDFYVNETNRHADYVLRRPRSSSARTFRWRSSASSRRPSSSVLERGLAPAGEARQEWEVVDDDLAPVGVAPTACPRCARSPRRDPA